jgi:hypothetical protein
MSYFGVFLLWFLRWHHVAPGTSKGCRTQSSTTIRPRYYSDLPLRLVRPRETQFNSMSTYCRQFAQETRSTGRKWCDGIALKCNSVDTKGQYTASRIADMIVSSPWYGEEVTALVGQGRFGISKIRNERSVTDRAGGNGHYKHGS